MIPYDHSLACYLEVGDVAGLYNDDGKRVPQTIVSIENYRDESDNYDGLWIKTEEDPEGAPVDYDDLIPLYMWD